MTQALSSDQTLVARAPAATPLVFTDIAELGDIQIPELSRKEFDVSVQNKKIDAYVLGILRRGTLMLPLNFIPTNASQDHLTGLYKAIIDKTIDGYRCTFPDATVWIMSGQVQSLKPKAPVDGKLAIDATIRLSGLMSIAGVVIGA